MLAALTTFESTNGVSPIGVLSVTTLGPVMIISLILSTKFSKIVASAPVP
jgi:hypothetical protein